jgi:hypothetical protein
MKGCKLGQPTVRRLALANDVGAILASTEVLDRGMHAELLLTR